VIALLLPALIGVLTPLLPFSGPGTPGGPVAGVRSAVGQAVPGHIVTAPEKSVPSPDAAKCADLLKVETPERVPGMFGAATGELLWLQAGSAYVECRIRAGEVTEVVVLDGNRATVELDDGVILGVELPRDNAAWLTALAAQEGVRVRAADTPKVELADDETGRPNSGVRPAGIIALLASVGVITWLGVSVYRRRRNQARVPVQGSGRNRLSRNKGDDVPETRFSDVAGCKEAIEDLREMVDVLTHPERFDALGARPPKGALLVGPPGTGKTLLARAVAGEAGVPFFSCAGSDFVEMYVGVGARRVRDVFGKAKKAGRAIVFIDEIDAVGRRRSDAANSGGAMEVENTMIALLNELDGFETSGVVVLAATNRPDVLDPALTRPGRLDRRVHVGLPDVAERAEVLGVHLRNKPVDEDVTLADLARRTPGFSGAQLEQVANEAALLAARDGVQRVDNSHLNAAVEYVATGRARHSAVVTESDRLVTAWHEAGHTVAALRHPDATRPVAVSIVPRGAAGGVTWMGESDSQLMTRGQLRARLVVALAGRAAEERLLGGEHTAGAASDLISATEVARAMVDRFGMTGRGLAVRDAGTSDRSDNEVDALLGEAFATASGLLERNRDLLEAVVRDLLEHQDLDAAWIARLDAAHPAAS